MGSSLLTLRPRTFNPFCLAGRYAGCCEQILFLFIFDPHTLRGSGLEGAAIASAAIASMARASWSAQGLCRPKILAEPLLAFGLASMISTCRELFFAEMKLHVDVLLYILIHLVASAAMKILFIRIHVAVIRAYCSELLFLLDLLVLLLMTHYDNVLSF